MHTKLILPTSQRCLPPAHGTLSNFSFAFRLERPKQKHERCQREMSQRTLSSGPASSRFTSSPVYLYYQVHSSLPTMAHYRAHVTDHPSNAEYEYATTTYA